jgi:hypothetical protein
MVVFTAMPFVATADEISDEDMREQMRLMQQRMRRMEDQLADAKRMAPAKAPSDCFFCSIEFEGWIAASYFYNTRGSNDTDLGGFNSGAAPVYPFHPDHNSFSVDQIWLGMERPVNENQRAGFRLDFAFGKVGDILNGVNDGASGSQNDFHIYQAYISYLAPLGEGVEFKFGKFGTLIGAEVAQTTANYNITRSNLYNLFQPITHTGILATTSLWEGGTTSFGVVNETRAFTSRDIDLDNDKAMTWQVGHQINDATFISFNGAWGGGKSGSPAGFATPDGEKELIIDIVATWDPTEKFSSYVNFDFIDNEAAGAPEGWGLATAGRYAFTDRMGVAGRIEYADLEFGSNNDLNLFGLTGTLDYLLTTNLMLRGEVRYDQTFGGDIDDAFFSSGGATRRTPGGGQQLTETNQVTVGAEVVYTF